MVHTISKGLDVPISGQPVQAIEEGPAIQTVALLGNDYVGMRPTLLVGEDDRVQLGQPVFTDKKTEGVVYTAPGSGRVVSINRGAKRRFLSMIIELDGSSDEVVFDSFDSLQDADAAELRRVLVESGLWTAFRTRPFSRVPSPTTEPNSIFVTAMDTNPLAAEPELIIDAHRDLFIAGLTAVSRLTQGKTYVCTREDSRVPGERVAGVQFEQFSGPHPAGLVGTHIAMLDPVGPNRTVWHLNYQDVIAIGHLLTTGRLMTERVIAVAGPRVTRPALYRTRLGACTDELLAGNVQVDNTRVISGSILCGREAAPPENFLGRYHLQVAALEEGNKREFLGWQGPGFDKFSITRIYAGSLGNKRLPLTTSTGGSRRAMVPVGTYERVMPLDILPTQLLRALIVKDTEQAQALGCLELDEEDLGLCTFVCPGKYEYGSILRENLTTIEKEG